MKTNSPAVRYELPRRWMLYDASVVMKALVQAKASAQSLQAFDEGDFMRKIKEMPKGKSFKFLG